MKALLSGSEDTGPHFDNNPSHLSEHFSSDGFTCHSFLLARLGREVLYTFSSVFFPGNQ